MCRLKLNLQSSKTTSDTAKQLGVKFVDLDTLLIHSDFVVLAVPLTNKTRHIINKSTLGKMKENAILVNVGRGGKSIFLSIASYYFYISLFILIDVD